MTILIILFALILLSVAVYWAKKTHFLLNPITVILGIWGIILPLSIWQFYGTSVPSAKAFIIIGIGLFAFFLGAYFGMKPITYKMGAKTLSTGYIRTGDVQNYKFNYLFLYILGIITLIYYISQIIVVIGLLRSGYSYDYIRQLAVSSEETVLRSSTFISQIRAFVATPTTYLLLAILPIELLNKNRHLLLIIEVIVVTVLHVFTTGGRSVLLWLIYYLIFILLYLRKKIDFKRIRAIISKYLIWFILGGIVLVALLLWMTFSRKGNNVDLLEQLYIYFVCPIQNFDHHLDTVENSGMYGFGLSSFYGLLYPVMYVLSRLGINIFTPYVDTIYSMSFQDLEVGVNIGGDVSNMNAFVTMFYQPYLDGRYVGVIVVMLIFGFVAARFFYSAYYNQNIKSLLIYLLLFQKLMGSMVRFYFTQQAQSICFILAFLVIFKYSKGEEKRAIKF